MNNEDSAPYVLALIICDAIWQDPATGKKTILGTFSTLAASAFPAVHPTMGVLAVLTDGRGKTPIGIRVVRCDGSSPADEPRIWEAIAEVDFHDPRMVVELAIQINGLVLPAPGEYRFQVWCGEAPLMERRILLLQRSEQQHGTGESDPDHPRPHS